MESNEALEGGRLKGSIIRAHLDWMSKNLGADAAEKICASKMRSLGNQRSEDGIFDSLLSLQRLRGSWKVSGRESARGNPS